MTMYHLFGICKSFFNDLNFFALIYTCSSWLEYLNRFIIIFRYILTRRQYFHLIIFVLSFPFIFSPFFLGLLILFFPMARWKISLHMDMNFIIICIKIFFYCKWCAKHHVMKFLCSFFQFEIEFWFWINLLHWSIKIWMFYYLINY